MTYRVVHGNMRVVGSRVEIECPKYLTDVSGEKYTTCQANGSWSIYPNCTGCVHMTYFND